MYMYTVQDLIANKTRSPSVSSINSIQTACSSHACIITHACTIVHACRLHVQETNGHVGYMYMYMHAMHTQAFCRETNPSC